DLHGPVDGPHGAVRVEERTLQRGRRPQSADIAQVRREPRTFSVDAMAGRAAAFPFEHGPASAGVPDFDRRAVDVEAGANERDEAVQLRRLEPKRRHSRARHARGDDVADVLVGRDAAELSPAEVHAGDRVAVWSVTEGALARVQTRPGLNVRRTVLA